MARKFLTSLSVEDLASAASQALGIKVYGDTFARLTVDAGGKLTWSGGASAGDLNLYRTASGHLKSDQIIEAAGGVITLTTSGVPTATIDDGALAVDTNSDNLYLRSNGAWVPAGGGASVTVSDTEPSSPTEGDMWFESDTGDIFVYYDSVWVDVGGSSVANIAMSDTAPTQPTNGDFWFETDTARTFVYYVDGDSSQWVEVGATSAAAAGDEGYIQYYSGGTMAAASALYYDEANERVGIKSLAPQYDLHVSGSIGASAIYADFTGALTGNADTATALETPRTIQVSGDVAGSASFDGTGDINISTTIQADSVELGTDTTGDYIAELAAGTGVTIYNPSGEGASAGIAIGQDVATSSDVTFNDLTLTGNLTVQGTTTTLETATLQVEDNIIVLNYGQASPVLDGGIEIDRGSGTNVLLQWNESSGHWEFTNNGSDYFKLITSFDDVTGIDLTTTAPTSGDFLKFDGTNWVPDQIPEINTLNDIGNVSITSVTAGDFLKWSGSAWVNDAIDLSTDTSGDYVANLIAGTGVTIYNGTGQSASATIEIGQAVGTTDDVTFNTVTGTNGVVTLTSSGAPTATADDGAIAIDTANNVLYIRSGGAWVESSGGASVTISDTPPAGPEEGDLWYESDTGATYVYYDSAWIEIGAASSAAAGDEGYVQYYSGGFLAGASAHYWDSANERLGIKNTTPSHEIDVTGTIRGTHVIGSGGVITLTTTGAPTAALDDGAIAVDTTNDVMYIRSNGAWVESSGGASVTVSDTAPTGAEEGDLWYKSDVGTTLVYYDGTWVEITGSGSSSAYKLTSSSRDAALLIMEIGP